MTNVRNISTGPRGIHDASGQLVMIDPGQSRDLDLAEGAEAGEWFSFDGVATSAASAPHADGATAEHVAALTKRAEEAETMLDLVQDELATLKRSAPVVAAAVTQLDHANDEHWTKTGEPAVDAVKAIVGGNVTRADIEAAAPDFNREAAVAASAAA